MDLLDQLKRQAETQKQQHQAQDHDQVQILTSINEALLAASRYVTELANSLNVVKSEVACKLLDELAKLIPVQTSEFRWMGRHQESLRVRILPRSVEPAREAQSEFRPGLFGDLKSLWKK